MSEADALVVWARDLASHVWADYDDAVLLGELTRAKQLLADGQRDLRVLLLDTKQRQERWVADYEKAWRRVDDADRRELGRRQRAAIDPLSALRSELDGLIAEFDRRRQSVDDLIVAERAGNHPDR